MPGQPFDERDRELLIRIDKQLAVLETRVGQLGDEHARHLDFFVHREAFAPVAKITYGLAGTILVSVLLAMVWLVIKR